MIRREVLLMGTASPSPAPATAVLIPTIRLRRVGQCPAGTAGIQGGIGLDDILNDPAVASGPDRDGAAQSADHTRRHRARESQRVPDGDHQLPHLQ